MLTRFVFFAASDARSVMDDRSRNFFRLDPTDALLVLGVVVVLASLLFFWAYYVRKRPSDKHGTPILRERRGHHGQSQSHGEGPSEEGDRRRVRVRKKRRRHHPDNFPRNPTLGETGGLPPLRPEEESLPSEGQAEPPKTSS